MNIRVESAADPAAILDALMPELEQVYLEIYGPEEENLFAAGEPDYFTYPRGRLWVVYVDNELAGMAGWSDLAQLGEYNPFEVPTVELKRLFVRPKFQKMGLSKKMDEYRLFDVFNSGYELAVGETGHPQKSSIAMHQAPLYGPVQPFGEFHDNPDSVFFGATVASWLNHTAKRLLK